MIWLIWVVSIIYCIWRFYKRYQHSSLDGVIGPTPGLDIIIVVAFAPLLAFVDLIVTGFKYIFGKINCRVVK